MAKEKFETIISALEKVPAPKLKGEIVSETDDAMVIKSTAGVFRVARGSIASQKEEADGIAITLESDAKIIQEVLVDQNTLLGTVTADIFGGFGGIGPVAVHCDCKCKCDCKCDCDCKCLCDDDQLNQILPKLRQLAKFRQLDVGQLMMSIR